MLIEFSVGNFRSFREEVTFSMVAAPLKSKNKELDEDNVFEVLGQPALLTSAAVYGANASGKSNFVKAIVFMRNFVMKSQQETQATGAIDVDPFVLSTTTEDQPSYFEMVFVADGTRYRYGFELTTERVVSEWLYHVPKKLETRLFERTLDDYSMSSVFKEGKGIKERTRPNTLFLSAVAQWNGSIAQSIVAWFRRLGIASGLQDIGMRLYTVGRLVDDEDRDAIIKLVRSLDLAIDNITVKPKTVLSNALPVKMPDRVKTALRLLVEEQENTQLGVYTAHPKFDTEGKRVAEVDFDLDERESDGTQKLFDLAGPIVTALRRGQVLVVDEFDARLHPLMTVELVRRFNSTETNPNHAQLIFTTHDTNLLANHIFRRDQVWFAEKDRLGGTDLYSLAEFKVETASGSSSVVRNDASYARDYIKGRYGAIPMLGNLRRVVVGN